MPKEDVEWFYNEVTVPEEGDIPSSYYMACGFGEGYFGMQNNSPHQRKILFSVWSPFNTDNPADIPDSLRVTLVKKGANTVIKEFGNEGSGGQSFMYYDWKPGERCRFLMGARPDGKGNTVYTAYFFDNNKGEWRLWPLSVAPRPLPGTQGRTRSSRTSAPCRAIATARHTIRTNGRVLPMAVGCP